MSKTKAADLGYFQMKRWYKFFYVISFIHLFACATAANTLVASNQGEIPAEKLAVEEVAAKKQNFLEPALDFYQASQELWSRGELEGAINALDQAYSLILEVKSESDPATIQQKEDLRILISRRLIEIYASRYTAVNGDHKAIPLTMNERVEYEIKQFQTVEREFFINSYKRSGRYIGKIVKGLNEAGLPEELAWLPLVESGFKVRAFSPARALGLWQFIASTGYKFGLKRNDWIDERLDPEKSTKAAIAYLQELHRMFGDWTTVLAAYNSGEENVLRVIRGQKINYLDNFWDLYKRLPLETARYVPRFLATLHILKGSQQYGFNLGETEKPLSFEVLTIEKQVRLDAIANELGISEALLSDLNPELRLKVTPPTPCSLRIPCAMSAVLRARLDRISEWPRVRTTKIPSGVSHVYHRVSKGETLSSIAKRYETTVPAISKANNMRDGQLIKIGLRLKIPLSVSKTTIEEGAIKNTNIGIQGQKQSQSQEQGQSQGQEQGQSQNNKQTIAPKQSVVFDDVGKIRWKSL